MADFLDILKARHSIRKYSDRPIPKEMLDYIIKCGLISPSSKGINPWHLYVVSNKEVLEKMSFARGNQDRQVAQAQTAILVAADSKVNDVWAEDCAIVMINMHNAATELGLGSCWVQMRNRGKERPASDYLKELFNMPEEYECVAILSLGFPAEFKEETKLEDLQYEKVTYVD